MGPKDSQRGVLLAATVTRHVHYGPFAVVLDINSGVWRTRCLPSIPLSPTIHHSGFQVGMPTYVFFT